MITESQLPGTQGWTWLVFRHPREAGAFCLSHAFPPSHFLAVLNDLRNRYGRVDPLNTESSRIDEPLYHLDFGGMANLRERKIHIDLPGQRVIECYAHHGLELRNRVKELLADESKWRPGTGSSDSWVKIHGSHHVCCVSVDDLVVMRDVLAQETNLPTELQAFVAVKNVVIDDNPNLTRPGKVWGPGRMPPVSSGRRRQR